MDWTIYKLHFHKQNKLIRRNNRPSKPIQAPSSKNGPRI